MKNKTNLNLEYKKNVLFVIMLFLLSLLMPNLFSIMNINYPILLQLLVELIVLFFGINFYKQKLKESWQESKKHWLKYLLIAIGITIIIIFLNTLVNSIIMNLINVNIPNKTMLYQIQSQTPIYWILSVLFISPIVETLVIPVSFFELLKENKIIYLISTTLLYGMFYVIFSIKTPLQLFYIISYGIVGFSISLLYFKKNNMFLPLIVKFLYALFTVFIFIL